MIKIDISTMPPVRQITKKEMLLRLLKQDGHIKSKPFPKDADPEFIERWTPYKEIIAEMVEAGELIEGEKRGEVQIYLPGERL